MAQVSAPGLHPLAHTYSWLQLASFNARPYMGGSRLIPNNAPAGKPQPKAVLPPIQGRSTVQRQFTNRWKNCQFGACEHSCSVPPTIASFPCRPSHPYTSTHTHTPGSQDGTVHVWLADTGEKVVVLDGGHPGPTHCAQFNPKLMMMATACSSTVGCDRHVIVM